MTNLSCLQPFRVRLKEDRVCFLFFCVCLFRIDRPADVCWQRMKQWQRQSTETGRGRLMEQVLEGDKKL